MINKVISTIERNRMLKNGTTIIVALSGGADSMALLRVLMSLQAKYSIKLIAAHVNHGLRGPESDRDELFIRQYCEDHSVALKVLQTDVGLLASSSGEGIEECGRRVRYEFFDSVDDNAVVATAHTLSDSFETMIFNLVRGTALKGLCGIPAVRSNIIRPLIECTRLEIEDYCQKYEIPYLMDSTNLEDKYTRNFIRLNIIPQFKRINPKFYDAFLRCSETITSEDELLSQLSEELMQSSKAGDGYKTDILLASHPALRRRVLAKILYERTGIFPQNKQIVAVDTLLQIEGNIQVQCGIHVKVCDGYITFPKKNIKRLPWCFKFHEGKFEIGDKTLTIRIVNKKDLEKMQNIHTYILDNCFDYDKIIGKATIRSRCEGDEIRLSKRHCTKSIKKLFNENSIPVNQRNDVAVIADNEGALWVERFGTAQRCEVNDKTKNIVLII